MTDVRERLIAVLCEQFPGLWTASAAEPADAILAAFPELTDHRAEVERLTRENNVLRGIATKIMPCHYCGADELAKCPYGFPGCALADDLFPADETQATWMADLRKSAEAAEAALATAEARTREECAKIAEASSLHPPYTADGAQASIAAAIRARKP